MWFDWLAVKRSWDHDIRIKTGCFQLFDIILILKSPTMKTFVALISYLALANTATVPQAQPEVRQPQATTEAQLERPQVQENRQTLSLLRSRHSTRGLHPSTNSAWVATTSTGTATLALTTTAPSEAGNLPEHVKECGIVKSSSNHGDHPYVGKFCFGDELLALQGDCTRYLVCVNSFIQARNCPHGTFFSPAEEKCVFYYAVNRQDCVWF